MTFRSQLTFFFLITALLAVGVASLLAYTQAIQVLKNNFIMHTSSTLGRTKDQLLTKLHAVEKTINFICTDPRIQNLHTVDPGISARSISRFFVDCIALNDYEESSADRELVKNLIDELIFYNSADQEYPVIISRRDHFTAYGIEDYLSTELLTQAKAAQGEIIWSDIFYNELGDRLLSNAPEEVRREELHQLAVVKYVSDEKFKKEIGFIIASINLARLSDLVEEIILGKAGRVYLVDEDLRVLAGRDKGLILRPAPLEEHCLAYLAQHKEGNLEGRFNGEESFIYFEEIGINHWKLVGVIASSEFLTSAGVVRNRILFGGIGIFLVFIVVALILADNITKPLQKICGFLQKVVGTGDLQIRTAETGSIEIENLCQNINQMIERISRLLEEVYQEQLFKRKMALKALHTQINPHFIYNTLDSISWMVETGRREVAADLLESLSTFFRIGLSGGRDLVTIREEVKHAESYLKVQKIRYQNKLDYVFSIDDDLMDRQIVKITLQPLIENAIYHGIKPKPDGIGTILISGGREDEQTIKLSVIDNGVGMSAEKTGELQSSLEEAKLDLETSGKGYSLVNINSRIKLYFGREYGLVYSSKPGVGTRVDIFLPARVLDDTGRKDTTL